MESMTSHERMKRTYEHREVDRVPITDYAWESTVANWNKQGLPPNIVWEDYFGLDKIARITEVHIDTSPRCKKKIIEDAPGYRIEKDEWGVTKKNFKPISTTPIYLDHEVHDLPSWTVAKERMFPSKDRINWDIWKKNYKFWRENGYWIEVGPWFGYDIVNTRMVGQETTLIAMLDDPEWVRDMFDHGCNLTLALLDMIWKEGYEFDELLWYDDLGYKNGLMISKQLWSDLVKPYQQKTIHWAHAHSIKAHMHSCGRVNDLIPDLVEMGLDCINPMEIKAGMDPLQMKKDFGKDLCIRGGFDIMKWMDIGLAEADIREKLPTLKEGSGYVFSSDHSIADSVTVENYRRIVEIAKEVGRND